MNKLIASAALIAAIGIAPSAAWAQDDDDDDEPQRTMASQEVPELIIGSPEDDFAVNQTDFELLSNQGYRWKITSNGRLEYKFHTDLFRHVWMNQIVIEDLEVHMNGAPAWLEFDSDGTIQVQFNTVRPGIYSWSIPDLADRGMQGTITIK